MSEYKIAGGVLGTKAVTLGQFDEFLDWLIDGSGGSDPQDLYKCVAWSFWAANLRANNIAKVPYAVYPIEMPEDEEDEDNQIEWPIDMRPLLWYVEMWLCLKGAAYLYKERAGNMLSDLMVLNANSMKVKAWDRTGPTLFEQKIGTQVQLFPAEDIVYFRTFNSKDDIHEGVHSGQVAIESGKLIKNANLWASGFFENGAIPSIILEAEGQIKDSDRKEIKKVWKRALGGIRNVWEVMVLRKGLNAKVISPPIGDLAMPDLERTKRDQILAAHMIPPGLGETKTNRSEREMLEYELWDQALIPRLEVHLGPTLDKQLFNPLGLRISFKPNQVEAIQRMEIAKAESAAFYVSGVMSTAYDDNVISVDEYRRVVNTVLVMGDMPKLDESFTPEERTPPQLLQANNSQDNGNDDEGMGNPGDVAENIENRAAPKALAPEWGRHRVSLQN